MLYSKNFISYSSKNKSNFNSLKLKNKQQKGFLNTLSDCNIYIIKKERIYTKLKYSRVPQFDIASGAIASLVAALFGFMVTEKFGFELLDSGDFYTVIMYLIFVILIIKNVANLIDSSDNKLKLLSLKNVLDFYLKLIKLLVAGVKKNFLKKIFNI